MSVNENYKYSFYNIEVKTDDDKTIVYNTKTGSLLKLKNTEVHKIRSFKNKQHDETVSNEILDFLVKNGILVYDDTDEYNDVLRLGTKELEDLHITLIPTYNCNFNCPYCFVSRKNQTMNQGVYDSIIKFIDAKVKENPDMQIYLMWFGGEPLIESNSILKFMKKLKEVLPKNLIVHSNIISNGYLLSYDNFKGLYESGVRNYQITFEPDKEYHNVVRTNVNLINTFDKIYNNLIDIKAHNKGDFNIKIRVNVDKKNSKAIEKFIKKFKEDFFGDKRFDLILKPIINYSKDENENIIYFDGYKGILNYEYNLKKVTNKILEKEEPYLPIPKKRWCNSTSKNSFIFSPLGEIYSCESVIGNEDEIIGKINNDGIVVFNENLSRWKDNNKAKLSSDECKNCRILPICMGSCKKLQLYKSDCVCYWKENELINLIKEQFS